MGIKIILAQLIAIMVICLNAIGTSSTNKSSVMRLNGICNGLSGTQYILLSAYTGCTSCILAIIRNLVFAAYNKKGKNVPIWTLIVYIIISIVINIPLYDSWFAFLPILNVIVYGYGIWQENTKKQKRSTIFVGITGLIYNFFNMAYVSMINAFIDIVGGLIGLIKCYKAEKEEA